MPRPINKNMDKVISKYQTGQYGVNELARMYDIDKATISRFIKKHNIKVNQLAKNAIDEINNGMNNFQTLIDETHLTSETNANKAFVSDLPNISVVDNNINLMNEIVDIVREKNPQFAKGFQALSALMLKRSHEILNKDEITSSDISNISNSMSKMNDTLGVFPKMPTIAQQFNIGKNDIVKNKQPEPFKIEIDFK